MGLFCARIRLVILPLAAHSGLFFDVLPFPMHGMSEPTDNHWHLDKKVPISIILVIVMQGITGLWVVADIKKDVEVLKAAALDKRSRDEAAMLEQRNRDERQDRATAEAVALVRQDIQEVSRKVDRLIERRAP